MSRSILVSAFFLAVALAIAAAGSLALAAAAPGRLQARQVNISVTCNEGAVDEVTVRPWTVRASRNSADQVRWRLLQNSGVTSATIRPKPSSSWPFASTPPLTVSRNNTVDSGAITGAASSYFYDIVVDCGGGPTVIDPRMDIEP